MMGRHEAAAGGKNDLAKRQEPSNPFKKSARSPSPAPKARPAPGRPTPAPKARGGPPAPPSGGGAQPPSPPTSAKKKTVAPTPKSSTQTPARAGRSVGLRKKTAKSQAEAAKRTDERAKALIEATRNKVTREVAVKNAEAAKARAKKDPANPFKKKAGGGPRPAPQRRGGRWNKRNKPQGPAKRTLKLHRGKYMEFKYDVRKILEAEDIAEEHRSNVLGQTWAKGERQGIPEAKAFLAEKIEEGLISENCAKRIIKLIDSLTTRR